MGAEQSNMQDTIFNLRMTEKQLERMSKKADSESKKQRERVRKAIADRNPEVARIYAENAIRKKSEATNYLRMASRINATSSRISSAMSMKQITKQMGQVTHDLDKAMASMDLEKMSMVMDKFESQFENLDVRAGMMEGAFASATGMSAPEDEVDMLMQQVADENGLEIAQQLDAAKVGENQPDAVHDLSKDEDEELRRRLAAIRS